MRRNKPTPRHLISLLLAAATLPAAAGVRIDFETEKTYRQDSTGVNFRAGEFNVNLRDGAVTYDGGCKGASYFPPNLICTLGATGFVSFGNVDPDNPAPEDLYYQISAISPAVSIEPRREDLCILRAAPASKLERPLPGFIDTSFAVYYNISPGSNSIREYIVTRYSFNRSYADVSGGELMTAEVVPGVYNFSFPRLTRPDLLVALPTVHYPIPEGYTKVSNIRQGVRFNYPNVFNDGGFAVLDPKKIPTVKWEGLTRSLLAVGSDKLYFSVRFLEDEADSLSEVEYNDGAGIPQAIFPNVSSGADPRVLLANPLVTSYTLPPIIKSGLKGVIELELVRSLSKTGVAYDNSSRKFQIPVHFGDHYVEFAQKTFGNNKVNTAALEDFDADGFNNLTEWVLDSSPANKSAIPVAPKAVANRLTNLSTAYFGFTVAKKKGLIPDVVYTLKRSIDAGLNWTTMVTDANWTVTDTAASIKVQSKIKSPPTTGPQVQPPGTAAHLYRVDITPAP